MSLTLALNNAISGLNVNQRALATISQNIANANTVGYTRKTVDQSSIVLNGTGAGVKIDDISRKVDDFLSRAVRAASSNMSQAEALSNYMERLQVYMGEPGQSNSLDSYILTFFNQLQSLAETPEITSYRSQTVAAANALAQNISDLAYAIQNMRYEADIEISTGIKQFNATLKTLDSVNTAIAQATAYGNPSADLLDKRDTLLKDVASFMDVQVLIQPDGRAFVYTRNGQSILDESRYQLEYNGSNSLQNFTNDAAVGDIIVRRMQPDGSPGVVSSVLVKGGVAGQVDSSKVTGGTLKGLLQVRDEIMPEFVTQLDQLAATMRDEFNAVHNQGSGFPGATSYTGTRAGLASDYTGFSGAVQIAMLNADGTPYTAPYGTGTDGMLPLTIDFSKLNAGYGNGTPTLQSIIDEINNHYGTPQSKVELGNLSNIQMAATSNNIPGIPPNFTFDFDLQNISGGVGKFFVTDVTVADDTGTDITNVTSTQPQIALDPAVGYTTTLGSSVVKITTSVPHGLKAGDIVYLGDPGASVNGISAASLTGYFTVGNVTANGFEVSASSSANATGAVAAPGVTAMPPYHTIQTGVTERTGANGQLTANLSGNTNSLYYDFTMSYGVVEADGSVSTSTVTYRVLRDQNILNQRFSADSATGAGTLVEPNANQALLKASMVDENGVEIPTVNGKIADVKGYLKIESLIDGAYVSFTDLGSSENGVSGVKEPSGRNFFHYFEMNNFFESNVPTATGDTVKNSALNFAVEKRLLEQPNLITTGKLTRSNQPTDPTKPPVYTYERYGGDNTLVQKLAKLGAQAVAFTQAGSLPASKMSFSGYAGEMLGYFTEKTKTAQNTYYDQAMLAGGLEARADSMSGVNLDQELADTIIYQNAYTASARIITVTNDLFSTLLSSFN